MSLQIIRQTTSTSIQNDTENGGGDFLLAKESNVGVFPKTLSKLGFAPLVLISIVPLLRRIGGLLHSGDILFGILKLERNELDVAAVPVRAQLNDRVLVGLQMRNLGRLTAGKISHKTA